MKKNLPIVAAAALLTGCAGMSAEVLVGAKVAERGFDGPMGPTATIRIRKPLTDNIWCEAEHVSHVFAGEPFGKRSEEDALNQIGCGMRFGGDR